jgi:uncharacterized membrane protein YdjX (TVP38/TMEM64 family)
MSRLNCRGKSSPFAGKAGRTYASGEQGMNPNPENKNTLSWAKIVPVALIMIVSMVLYSTVDLGGIRHWLQERNGPVVFLLIVLLPLFGFPVSLAQILAGAKFGLGLGFLVTTVSILVHMLGMYWIGTGFLRRPIASYLERHRHHLPQVPEGEQNSLAFLMTLLPGSYALKNYIMVVGGISLRTLLWVCLPVYAVRAIFGIYFGHFSADPSTFKLVILVGNTVLITIVSAYLVKRLKKRWDTLKSARQGYDSTSGLKDKSAMSGK